MSSDSEKKEPELGCRSCTQCVAKQMKKGAGLLSQLALQVPQVVLLAKFGDESLKTRPGFLLNRVRRVNPDQGVHALHRESSRNTLVSKVVRARTIWICQMICLWNGVNIWISMHTLTNGQLLQHQIAAKAICR